MKRPAFIQGETIGDFLRAILLTVTLLIAILLVYFYLYLPASTSHGEEITAPDFRGIPARLLDSAFEASGLRYEISDSSYNEEYGPLEVSQQFPAAGSTIKPGRKVFVTINRLEPPTVPIPALTDLSATSAQSILKSNGLRTGRITYRSGPFEDLVISMAINGYPVKAGVRVPKGTAVDLVVSDGGGSSDFVVNNLIGLSYSSALVLITNWNLHLGNITLSPGTDTTRVEPFVYRQIPSAGDSVRVGQPIHLWIGPKSMVGDSTDVDL